MSVLVDRETRLLVQGMGKHGTFHAMGCRDYGTNVVGGVTPGKGGTTVEGFPLFDTVEQAVRKTGANASVIFVPPAGRRRRDPRGGRRRASRSWSHHRGHPDARHGQGLGAHQATARRA